MFFDRTGPGECCVIVDWRIADFAQGEVEALSPHAMTRRKKRVTRLGRSIGLIPTVLRLCVGVRSCWDCCSATLNKAGFLGAPVRLPTGKIGRKFLCKMVMSQLYRHLSNAAKMCAGP